ncbi:hypothetical protein GCM10010315_15350 [Streptomyces luteosporeus]|uniref:Uncharacterized protein n=1 Tax=Streptomyces luteosporeus TaxID=173856 RepID=A0ABN3TN24_9ACTN
MSPVFGEATHRSGTGQVQDVSVLYTYPPDRQAAFDGRLRRIHLLDPKRTERIKNGTNQELQHSDRWPRPRVKPAELAQSTAAACPNTAVQLSGSRLARVTVRS